MMSLPLTEGTDLFWSIATNIEREEAVSDDDEKIRIPLYT